MCDRVARSARGHSLCSEPLGPAHRRGRVRGGTLACHSGERESMRKKLISGCLVVLVAGCAPSERPKASVELTQGSVEGRKALAEAVLRDLSGSLKDRVRLWVPTATTSGLDSLHLSAKTSSEPSPSGGTTVKVWLQCSFALDAIEADAKQTAVLDACKGEVERALAKRAREAI
jgi:hypothetical protein